MSRLLNHPIHAVTFGAFCPNSKLSSEEARESFLKLTAKTGCNTITLVPNGLQERAQSETIRYDMNATCSDEELGAFIDFAHENGVSVILKPTVNCMDGTWRAHICFFERDVPCEPKWSNWFASYTEFQMHYARIAEEHGCEMFIPGCEMVQSEHREAEWRKLITDLRTVYSGPIAYNTDKYQEDMVTWWDAVDYIASSGYYPIDDWDEQLARIKGVVEKFKKPFFFAEMGCMSTVGSSKVPNDWSMQGKVDLQEQKRWYETAFSAIAKEEWIVGTCLWDWPIHLYMAAEGMSDKSYSVYAKPACDVVAKYYKK